MVTLQLTSDKSENLGEDHSSTPGPLDRDTFLASFPGLDPWFKRRWKLPKVEARGGRFRDRARWAIAIGVSTQVDDGGIARFEVALMQTLLDLGGNQGKTVNKWTHERLGERLGCHPRTVKCWLDGLRARGWVEWCHNMEKNSRGQVRQLANSYVLLIPDWVKASIDTKATKTAPADPTARNGQARNGRARSGPGGGSPMQPAPKPRDRFEALASGATGLPPARPLPEPDPPPVATNAGSRRSAGEVAAVADLVAGIKAKAKMKPRTAVDVAAEKAAQRPPP